MPQTRTQEDLKEFCPDCPNDLKWHLEALKHLFETFLQDSVVLRRRFPKLSIYNLPIFETAAYTAWEEKVVDHIRERSR